MTSSTLQRFGQPSTARSRRMLESLAARAADALAERTVWSVGARDEPHETAGTRRLDVARAEPLERLADCVQAMLRGDVTPAGHGLRGAERELCAESEARGEALLGDAVRPGDVVFLNDPASLTLGRAIKERGAHAVWRLERPSIGAGGTLMRDYTPTPDGYVVTWRAWTAALVPARDAVVATEIVSAGDAGALRKLVWASVLGELVELDRDDSVGGTLHARPSVAAR